MANLVLAFLSLFLLVGRAVEAPASALSDLGSVSQERRDAAAKILRSSYVLPQRETWKPLLTKVKAGMTKAELLELLRPIGAQPGSSNGSGQSHNDDFRLDDLWLLRASFYNDGEKLISVELHAWLRNIWVSPPPDFSGVWTTYFVNGQRSHEVHYQNGKYEGEFRAFHPNGALEFIQHYVQHRGEGEDLGYYPSGKLRYRGLYQNDKPSGVWTFYNEDGSVQSTQDWSKPR